jgi:hypothetical protein
VLPHAHARVRGSQIDTHGRHFAHFHAIKGLIRIVVGDLPGEAARISVGALGPELGINSRVWLPKKTRSRPNVRYLYFYRGRDHRRSIYRPRPRLRSVYEVFVMVLFFAQLNVHQNIFSMPSATPPPQARHVSPSMVYDIPVNVDTMTWNPLQHLIRYVINHHHY